MKLNQIILACLTLLAFTATASAFTVSVTGVNSVYQESDTISGTVHGDDKLFWAGARIYDAESNINKVAILGKAGNWPSTSLGYDVVFSYDLYGVLTPGKYHSVIVDADNWWSDKEWATAFFYLNKKPEITQPANTNVLVGETASYQISVADEMGGFSGTTTHAHSDKGPHSTTVSYSGDTSLTYKWDMDYNGVFAADYTVTEAYSSGTSFSKVVSHKYTSPGTHTVAYQVTDSQGAYDLKTSQVTVGSILPPVINSISASSPIQEGTTGTISASVTDPMGTAITYNWEIQKNGATVQTSNQQSFSYTFATAGTYSIKLIATNSQGASATQTISVTVTAAPVTPTNNAPTGLSIQTSCTNLACMFIGSATDADGDTLYYSWDFGNGNTKALSTNNQASNTYTAANTYIVVMTVTDQKATRTAQQFVTVTAGTTPPVTNVAPTAGFTPACNGLACTFTDASTDSDGTIASRAWNFGVSGATSTATSPAYTYAVNGTYTVTLTVYDDDGATNTHSETVIVASSTTTTNLPPKALFTYYVNGAKTSFTDASYDSDGTIASYYWTFGDGAVSSERSPSHSYVAISSYNATLLVTDNNGTTNSTSSTVTITSLNRAPTANAGLDVNGNTTKYIAFKGTGTDYDGGSIVLYEWDFDYNSTKGFEADWSSESIGVTTHKYTRAKTYYAYLRVTDNEGITATDTCVVRITGDDVSDEATTGRITYDFHLYGIDGLRTYAYDADEDTTTVKLKITNMVDSERNFLIRDIVPKSFATDIDDFSISPSYDKLYDRDPDMGWNVTLKPYETYTITYVFDGYKSLNDTKEDFEAPKVTEITEIKPAEEEPTAPETQDPFSALTGNVLGAFSDPQYGLIYLIVVIALVLGFWKREYVVKKWQKFTEHTENDE